MKIRLGNLGKMLSRTKFPQSIAKKKKNQFNNKEISLSVEIRNFDAF